MVDTSNDAGTLPAEPTFVEDLLLLLFDPASGTIAGEGTLFYVLGGAVLAELGARGLVAAPEDSTPGGEILHAVDGAPRPVDPLIADAFDRVSRTPTAAQVLLAAVGPGLRQPVLDRLVDRGYIHIEKRRFLGLIPTTKLLPGDITRRSELLASVREVLVDGAAPTPRIGALAALLSASGSLPTFHPEIPWSSPVIARAKQLEQGDWGAQAAEIAVTRTMTVIINSAVIAAVMAPKS